MTSLDDSENGVDVRTNFIEELYDKFLECRLCSRTYRHPKMLVCQHTFCSDCLEAHYEMDEQDRPYRFLLSHNRDLSCPCCRSRTPIPTGGISRLPDNFFVAHLSDVIRRRGPPAGFKSGGGGCDICRPVSIVWNDDRIGNVEEDSRQQQAATVKCVDCDKLLCADCAELHRETKVTASHALFTISDNHDVECKIHRNETLRFYCEPCEQCVCVLCALHEHKEHEVSSLADGLERHRGTFDSLLDDCKSRSDAVRQQLTLADAFKSSLSAVEDNVRHAAIDAIAAVRQRERELLEGLRSFVGDEAMRFLAERDTLSLRLEELSDIRQTMETMVGRTSVELLMTKKEVNERIHTALGRQQIQTPDRVRLGGINYVAGAKPFHDLHRPTPNVAKFFRTAAAADKSDVREDAVENHVTGRSSSSSSSSGSESDSDDSTSEDEGRQPGTVRVVTELSQPEHINLVSRSQGESDSEEGSDNDDDDNSDEKDDKNEAAAPITKICICDGVVRRMVIKSQSLCEETSSPPQPRESGRKIPDFGRPKPSVTYVDRGTEMKRLETADAATATPRVVACDKETYTGYIYLVHKNVSTDNQGTAEKGTSTVTDVTAAYRNVSNTGRSSSITRGTNTLKAMTSDRASSPIPAPLTPTAASNQPAAVAKVPAYPTNQRSGTMQVPPTTQKSSTSDAVSSTASQIPPGVGKLQADPQKTPGPANTALRVPPTTAITPAQPVPTTSSSLTTSQRQTAPVVTSTGQAGPISGKLPTSSPKLVTSSSTVSTSLPPVTAAAPNQSVTSPPQVMTSPVVAVSIPSQQRQPPVSVSGVSSASAAAMASNVRINSPTVTTVTMTVTGAQKPMMSSKDVFSKDAPLPSTLSQATQAAAQPTSSTQSVNRSAVTSPVITAHKQMATPMTSSATVSTAVAPASVTSPPLAAMQASLPRQPQSSSGSRSPSATLSRQSAFDAAPASQMVAVTSSPQTQNTSPVTQQSTASTSRTSSVPQKTSQPPSTMTTTPTTPKMMTSTLSQSQPTPNTSPMNVASAASQQPRLQTMPSTAAQKPVTSFVSPTPQPQLPTAIPPGTATPVQVVTSQAATNVNSMSNVGVPTPLVSTTTRNSMTTATLYSAQMLTTSTASQKPVTSLTSSTTQPQSPTTTAHTVTSQAATYNSRMLNAATFVSPVSTAARNSMTATTLSLAQMTASTTAQKPVTSLASSTTQPKLSTVLTTTAQSTSQPAMSNNRLSNAVPQVSTTAQKLMTSGNGQPESVTSPSSPSSTAAVEYSAAVSTSQLALTSDSLVSSMRVASPTTSRPPSVFRSLSMDNLRAPSPVLRPPPPIMTTSVAAVTQRLNGGAANDSTKNGWKSNR